MIRSIFDELGFFWSELKSPEVLLLNPEGIRTTITEGSSHEHCCTANNSINTDQFQMREVGVYSVGCSGYGYLIV